MLQECKILIEMPSLILPKEVFKNFQYSTSDPCLKTKQAVDVISYFDKNVLYINVVSDNCEMQKMVDLINSGLRSVRAVGATVVNCSGNLDGSLIVYDGDKIHV